MFRQWILQCISTLSFSMLINGGPFGFFRPQLGLRQGDPLSPFLFILCSEALSRLLFNAEGKRDLHGVKIARNCHSLSHLMFVDDLLIFRRTNGKEAKSIQDCLSLYEESLGKKVNKAKSTMFFNANCYTSNLIRHHQCRLK